MQISLKEKLLGAKIFEMEIQMMIRHINEEWIREILPAASI